MTLRRMTPSVMTCTIRLRKSAECHPDKCCYAECPGANNTWAFGSLEEGDPEVLGYVMAHGWLVFLLIKGLYKGQVKGV
jgi:hypothetical protein